LLQLHRYFKESHSQYMPLNASYSISPHYLYSQGAFVAVPAARRGVGPGQAWARLRAAGPEARGWPWGSYGCSRPPAAGTAAGSPGGAVWMCKEDGEGAAFLQRGVPPPLRWTPWWSWACREGGADPAVSKPSPGELPPLPVPPVC